MTEDEQRTSILITDCTKEVSAHILNYADAAGLDRLSFLINVAAVLASSALAAQPEDQLPIASRHIQNALGLVHCLREAEDSATIHDHSFAAPETFQRAGRPPMFDSRW